MATDTYTTPRDVTLARNSDYIGAVALARAVCLEPTGCLPTGDMTPTGITPCIPGRKSRGTPVKYDKRRYKRRNRIEVMFGRLKDWPIVGETVHWTVS